MKKIKCTIRQKDIKETPEETVRQEFLKVLLEDYAYNQEDIQLEYPTKKSPSDKKSYLLI